MEAATFPMMEDPNREVLVADSNNYQPTKTIGFPPPPPYPHSTLPSFSSNSFEINWKRGKEKKLYLIGSSMVPYRRPAGRWGPTVGYWPTAI